MYSYVRSVLFYKLNKQLSQEGIYYQLSCIFWENWLIEERKGVCGTWEVTDDLCKKF